MAKQKFLTPYERDFIRHMRLKLSWSDARIAEALGRSKQGVHRARKQMEAEGTFDQLPLPIGDMADE